MLPPVLHILVIRGGALGDGLLTLPALATLRTRWPAAAITLIGPRTLLPFARAAGFVDTVLPIEEEAGLALMREGGVVPPWADADLAIVWLQQWEEVAAQLRRWRCSRVVAGPSLPPPTETLHVADHLYRMLGSVDIGPSRMAFPLVVPDWATEAGNEWWRSHRSAQRLTVAVHVGSGGRRKCWPADRYAELAQRLLRSGCGILICLGPAEMAAAAAWQQFAAEYANVALAGNLDLMTLAGLLRHCAGFVGNDAGVTHLAAALGVPTVAIFGPTDPMRWAPIGRWVRVLRDPAWLAVPATSDDVSWQLLPPAVECECLALLATAALDRADTEL
jgi:heptosyltransferase III